jgi:hypothetical protein
VLRCAPGLTGVAAAPQKNGKVLIAALSNVAASLFIAPYDPKTGFGAPTVVPILGGGGHGRVLNWTSPELGAGFLVVTPLAEDPLRFVPITGDDWLKGTPQLVASPLAEEGVVTAACAINPGAGKRAQLAVVLGGKTSLVLLLDEKSGKFTATNFRAPLPGPGLGLCAFDFNKDGSDDLFVTTHDEVCFFFVGADGLSAGPAYPNPGMLGPVAWLNNPRDSRPELVVLNENKKARIFRPAGSDPTLLTRALDAVTDSTAKTERTAKNQAARE